MTVVTITIYSVDVIPAKNMLEVRGSAEVDGIPVYPTGGWPFFIINPPLYIEDVAGDIEVPEYDPQTGELIRTKLYSEDPLAAVVETIRQNIEEGLKG